MPGQLQRDTIYAGDDWRRTFTVTQDNAAVNLDTEGWGNIRAQWRSSASSGVALDIAVDTSQVASGIFTLSLTGVQTEQMGGDGVYDVQTTGPDGAVTTRLRGETVWIQDVTR